MSGSGDRIPVLTVDGPSGVGKGAVSSRVARRLRWHVLDSGACYRVVALAALDAGLKIDQEDQLVALCERVDLSFEATEDGPLAWLGGEMVDSGLRAERVSRMASQVAALAPVRAALLDLQRSFCRPPGLVADGRDMGTVVFPDAPIKVFLDASIEERANRRYKQLKEKGENVKFAGLFRELKERDRRDRERAVSPTLPAADATIIDTSDLGIEAVVDRVLALVSDWLA